MSRPLGTNGRQQSLALIFLDFGMQLYNFVPILLFDKIGGVFVGSVTGDFRILDLAGEGIVVDFADFAFAFTVAPGPFDVRIRGV